MSLVREGFAFSSIIVEEVAQYIRFPIASQELKMADVYFHFWKVGSYGKHFIVIQTVVKIFDAPLEVLQNKKEKENIRVLKHHP